MRRRCLKNDSKLQDGERDGEIPVHYSDVIYSSIINIPPYPVVADQGLAEQTTNENMTYDQPANDSTAVNLLTNRGPGFQSANMGELPITLANQNEHSRDAEEVDCTLYNQTDHTYTPLSLRHVEPEYTQPRSHDDVDDDVAHLYATVSQDEGVVDNVIYESSCSQDNETTSGQC
ncbi:uncharacterized protein LOC144876123 [Branchiostoma floridae x Branchiostoma japonicum]